MRKDDVHLSQLSVFASSTPTRLTIRFARDPSGCLEWRLTYVQTTIAIVTPATSPEHDVLR